MTVNQSSRSGCDPYLPQPQWFWAGDNQNNTNLLSMTQCGITRFYNTDQRGTRPFTITVSQDSSVRITD